MMENLQVFDSNIKVLNNTNNYIILHGSFGSKDGNWFPWLKKFIEELSKNTREQLLLLYDGDGIIINE